MTKQYDVKCPVCGTVNKNLYLNETDGWMICENCGAEVKAMGFDVARLVSIPVLTMEQLTRMMAEQQEVAV